MKLRVVAWLLPLLVSCGEFGPVPTAAEPMPTIGDVPAPHSDANDRTTAPYFMVPHDDPNVDPLPLRQTRAEIAVAGTIANVRLTQVYKNEGKKAIEATYVFPMSTHAAVHALTMRIGQRTIEAEIRERKQARAEFDAARARGQTASLLEEDRPNVFRMQVTNIQPSDEITVELQYVEAIAPVEHVYELVIPTVVGPRFVKSQPAQVREHDRSLAAPYLHAGVPAAHTFALHAIVDTAVALRTVGCVNHKVDIAFPSQRRAEVTLAEGDDVGDRDFILRWKLEGDAIGSGLIVGESGGEHYFLLAIEPPARVEPTTIVPREYIFVIDVSGSMSGFPLDTSRELMHRLLAELRPVDRFDVLTFAGASQLFFDEPVPATPDNLRRADAMMQALDGRGATDLLPALQRALSLPRHDSARAIVLLTDGYVGVETESFELVRRSLGEASLFAFGIGQAVNRFLIEGLARAGQSQPFVVTKRAEAESAALRFGSYVRAPVLQHVKLDVTNFDAEELVPATIPDLYAERPLFVHGRFRGEARGTITVSGQTANGAFSQSINVAQATRVADGGVLRALWAREHLTWLEDLTTSGADKYHDEIVRIGLQHHLMTPFTSFIALDRDARGTDHPVPVEQPLPMPRGVSDLAVGSGLLGSLTGTGYGAGGLGTFGVGGGGSGEGAIGLGNLGRFGYGGSSGRASAPALNLGAATVSGSLDKEVIRRIVRRHQNELRYCYEKRLAKDPALVGRLVLKFVIAPDGRVTSSIVETSTLGEEVDQCVAAALLRWVFPAPTAGSVQVSYPLSFSP